MIRPPKGLDEREQTNNWLLRAYDSGHREGWEPGPSVSDTMKGMHGFCATSDRPSSLAQGIGEACSHAEEAMTD